VRDQRVLWKRNALPRDRVALLDRIAFNWSPKSHTWRSNYLALIAYKDRFGNCLVPQVWPENQRLASWVSTQRDFRRRGRLTEERKHLLEKVGFEWFAGKGTWEERFEEICEYRRVHGHCRVPARWKENRRLASWVVSQRSDRRRKELRREYEAKLDEIGFEWELQLRPEAAWRKWVEVLEQFIAENGHHKVPENDEEFRGLAKWMSRQRRADRKGQLSDAAKSRLEELGFPWKVGRVETPKRPSQKAAKRHEKKGWEDHFSELEDFFKNFGNCDVPQGWHVNRRLARWVLRQRESQRAGRLDPEHERRLNNLGFTWGSSSSSWAVMFDELQRQLDLSRSGIEPKFSPKLRRWMLTQRQFKKRGALDPDRERQLLAIGFEWEPFTARWHQMFHQLQEYRARHGHCNVPAGWTDNRQLANWVGVQRATKTAGKLSAEHAAALDGIGFTWRRGQFTGTRSPSESWDIMLNRLVSFHTQNGHTRVPQQYAADKKLGWWVTTQRRNRRRGKLTSQQIVALDALNFIWAPFDHPKTRKARESSPRKERVSRGNTWAKNFDALRRYKEEHGDCLVPQRWKDRALAGWVTEQRMARNRGDIDPTQEQQLAALGFDWNPTESAWNAMFEQLATYKEEHGHTDVPQRSGRYKKLACWVHNQRAAKKLKRPIMAEREKRLDSLGFSWGFIDPLSWDHMFEKLVTYHGTHGDCKVPQHWKEDPRFGKWVNTQRTPTNAESSPPSVARNLNQSALSGTRRLQPHSHLESQLAKKGKFGSFAES
jgi:Helicase associated domain